MSDCVLLESGGIYVPGINKILTVNIKESIIRVVFKRTCYSLFWWWIVNSRPAAQDDFEIFTHRMLWNHYGGGKRYLMWKCLLHKDKFVKTASKISLDHHKINENGDIIIKSDVVDFAHIFLTLTTYYQWMVSRL